MPSFNRAYELAVAAGINLVSATIKVALLTDSWTPDRTLDFFSQLTNELAAGDGYTAGGETLANKAVSTVSNIVYLDADNPSLNFTAAKSFKYAVIYIDTGTPATSSLIWYIDLNDGGGNLTINGAYTIDINASGLLAFQDAA